MVPVVVMRTRSHGVRGGVISATVLKMMAMDGSFFSAGITGHHCLLVMGFG